MCKLIITVLAVGMLIVLPAHAAKRRFIDNGNGTITDNKTGLMWEKKTDDGSIHDKDNSYLWTDVGDGDIANPDGTAFTDFLATLNGGATGVGDCASGDGSTVSGGFVGHCDWRLPQIDELRTILNCSFSACIHPIFGPTATDFQYWSATTDAVTVSGSSAWLADFRDGFVGVGGKEVDFHVRAVRGGR